MVNRALERFFSDIKEKRTIEKERIIIELNNLYEEATKKFVDTHNANEAIYHLAERETIGKVINLIILDESEAMR